MRAAGLRYNENSLSAARGAEKGGWDRMKKKWLSFLTAVALAFGMFAAPVTAAASEPDLAAARQDFYEAVNEEELEQMEIPADSGQVSQFSLIQDEIDAELESYIRECAASLDSLDEAGGEYQLGALYLCALDTAARDMYGYGTVVNDYLKRVENAESVKELLDICMEMDRTYSITTLVGAGYTADMKNVDENILAANGLSLPLSKAYWTGTDESSAGMRTLFHQFISRLYEINGKSAEEADGLAAQMCGVYQSLAPSQANPEDYYDPDKMYNVCQVSDLPAFFNGKLSLETFCSLYEAEPEDKVMISEPVFMAAAGSLMTEENLPLLKELVKCSIYRKFSEVSDTASLDALLAFNQQAYGLEEKESLEKAALYLIQDKLNELCGRVYVENYFDESSKEDVSSMAEEILGVFRSRLVSNTWMQEETKKEAIRKVDSMTVNVGYPDEWPSYMEQIRIVPPSKGGNLIDNVLNCNRLAMQTNIETRDEGGMDPTDWSGIATFEVNAFYQPSCNAIFFPAAILRGAFYDKDRSRAENLGGIGAVIGHEITHAFDNSGALYDEKGNYRNWWTDEDFETFHQLSGNVVDYYNGYECAGLPVNGAQTLGENIADLGGVSAVTELALSRGLELSGLYKQYAKIWATKETPEITYYLAIADVHAPSKVRVNAVLSAMPEFYEVFDVTEGDGMYQLPENRPGIW